MSAPAVTAPAARTERAAVGRLAAGGGLNLAGAISYGLLSFVVVVMLTRALGAAGAGAFMQAVGIFTILGTTAVLGADTGLVRALPQHLADGRSRDITGTLKAALGPVLAVTSLVAIAVYVLAGDFAPRLTNGTSADGDVAAYLRVLALFLPLYSLGFALLAATRGFSTMLPGVVLDKLARPVLQVMLLGTAIVAGAGVGMVMTAWAAPLAVMCIGAALWLRLLLRKAPAEGTATPLRTLFVEFWRFTVPRALASICRVTIQWLDVVLVGAMMSPRDAGIYAAATRLLMLGTFVSQALGQVSQPMFSRLLGTGDRTTARSVYATSTAWLIAGTWPLYFAAALFGPVILSVFGAEFGAGAAALGILALTRLISTGVGTADIVLLMGGKSTWSLGNTVVALALNIGLNIVLIPRYGIAGAALAWTTAAMVNNVAPLIQVNWLLGIHPFGRATSAAAAATTISYGLVGVAIRVVFGASVGALALYVLVGTALFLGLLAHWRRELAIDELLTAVRKGGRRDRSA